MDGILTLIQILNALKLNRVHLLGHSMGACLASLAAGVAPERFLSVALIEGLGPFSHPADTACKQLSDYLDYLTKKEPKKSKGYDSFDKAARARAVKGYVSLGIAQKLCERGLREEQGFFYWRHDERLFVPSPLRMTEEQILACLQQVTAKTCLIIASEGFSFEVKLMQNRAKIMQHLDVKRLEGGHHIHMEEPEMVAGVLVDFFESRDQNK